MERSSDLPRVTQHISDEARIQRHLGFRALLLSIKSPGLCVARLRPRRCTEGRRRREAGETEGDWKALDWGLRYSPSPALKEHTVHYHCGSPGPMCTRPDT